jgi:FkbM family methyltransferase
LDLLAFLKRPEYIFRPAQIFRRVKFRLTTPSAQYETVKLPWGLPIRVEPKEELGSLILRLGVYDLHACEYISRLVDPGELAVDAGANIGHMTSLMAMRAGPSGEVIAFEPNPAPFKELAYNVSVWRRNPHAAPVAAHNVALSDHAGVATLVIPAHSEGNRMLATLADDARSNTPDEKFEVPVQALDEIVGEGRRIGFLKLDVEGHELQVLAGCNRLLTSGGIRDILFEEVQVPPTPVTRLLESCGYSLFRAAGRVMGPDLRPVESIGDSLVHGPPNFIATRDPDRLSARMAGSGWSALRSRPSR